MIDIVDDGLLEFEVMVGNTAPSTVAGKKIASKCFNKCLILMGLDLINDLEESVLCDPDILGKFATYLAKYYVTKDDKLLMCDSAGQYLSGVNDYECLEADFYFWFMLYLIVSGGTCKTKAQCDNKSGNFIQPHLAALQGSGAASKVTKNDINVHYLFSMKLVMNYFSIDRNLILSLLLFV